MDDACDISPEGHGIRSSFANGFDPLGLMEKPQESSVHEQSVFGAEVMGDLVREYSCGLRYLPILVPAAPDWPLLHRGSWDEDGENWETGSRFTAISQNRHSKDSWPGPTVET